MASSLTRSLTILVAVLSGFLALTGCHKSRPQDKVINVEGDDAQMNAAIARARSEVNGAIEKLQGGHVDSFSVKVPIKDRDQTEHFWLKDVSFQNGAFTGTVDNDPDLVHTVKLGDRITAKKEEISDWLYMKDGKMHGDYTLRVLFREMSPDEVAKFKSIMVD